MVNSIQYTSMVEFVKNKYTGLFNYRISHLWYYNYELQVPAHEDVVRNVTLEELRTVFKQMTTEPNVTRIITHKKCGQYNTKCVEYYFNW